MLQPRASRKGGAGSAEPTPPPLARGLLCDGVDHLIHCFYRRAVRIQSVPLRNPRRAVERKPGLAVGVFPSERLQRQVNAGGLTLLHQRRTAFGTAEDQQHCWTQAHPGSGRALTVVDAPKHKHVALRDGRHQPLHRLSNRIAACDGEKAVVDHGCPHKVSDYSAACFLLGAFARLVSTGFRYCPV